AAVPCRAGPGPRRPPAAPPAAGGPHRGHRPADRGDRRRRPACARATGGQGRGRGARPAGRGGGPVLTDDAISSLIDDLRGTRPGWGREGPPASDSLVEP